MSRSRDIANLLGSSSPIVDKTIIDAKGDLLIGSADNTVTKLAAGSTGQIPLADSSTTSGLRYVDPPTNRNLIINGAMQVHQRGTSSTGITVGGYYTADQWNTFYNNLGTWTQSIENDAPSGTGLAKSLKMLCSTANSSPSASNSLRVRQAFEGQNLQRIKKGTASAEQLALSFWVKSNVTGTYVVELLDYNNSNRHVNLSYTVSASGTWERKTITFPSDAIGEFANNSSASLEINFWLGAGSNFTSGSLQTTWGSFTQANRAVGQTNLAAATNNYWQITGVQLETGPVATPFEFEPYEATLRKCQRYYYLHASGDSKAVGSGFYDSSSQYLAIIHFPTSMRSAPSLIATTGTNYYSARGFVDDYLNSLIIFSAHENSAFVYNSTEASTSGQTGGGYLKTANAASSIAFSADL